MDDPHAAAPSKHTVLAAWVFGSLLLLFYIGVFVLAPPSELPEFKQKQLAVFSALLCALFTFFFVGTLKVNLRIKNKWTQLGIQSGGGAAAFVLILWWWNNPDFAPVHRQKELAATPATTIEQITKGEASPTTIEKIPLNNKHVVQKTEGKKSPAIISGGDVSIKLDE